MLAKFAWDAWLVLLLLLLLLFFFFRDACLGCVCLTSTIAFISCFHQGSEWPGDYLSWDLHKKRDISLNLERVMNLNPFWSMSTNTSRKVNVVEVFCLFVLSCKHTVNIAIPIRYFLWKKWQTWYWYNTLVSRSLPLGAFQICTSLWKPLSKMCCTW